MDPIVIAAGTALVSAMASDAWTQARTGMVTLWRHNHAQTTAVMEADLDTLRSQVIQARENGDADTESALEGAWQLRLHEALKEDPAMALDLKRFLDDDLLPILTSSEQTRIRDVSLRARTSGSSRAYQAGRDQHINER